MTCTATATHQLPPTLRTVSIYWRPVIALLGPAQTPKKQEKWSFLASGHCWSAGQSAAGNGAQLAQLFIFFLATFAWRLAHSDRMATCPKSVYPRREQRQCLWEKYTRTVCRLLPGTVRPSSVLLHCSCLLSVPSPSPSHRSIRIEHGKTKAAHSHSPALNKRVDWKAVMSLLWYTLSGKSLPQSHFEVSLALWSAQWNCWLSPLQLQYCRYCRTTLSDHWVESSVIVTIVNYRSQSCPLSTASFSLLFT